MQNADGAQVTQDPKDDTEGAGIQTVPRAYAFDRCDGCGGPLPEGDRLWGFCRTCLCLPSPKPPRPANDPPASRSRRSP